MELEEALKQNKQLEADMEKLKADNEAILLKNTTLLDETKKTKQKAKEEADALKTAAAEKHEKDGNFEALLKSSEEGRKLAEEALKSSEDRSAQLELKNQNEAHTAQITKYGLGFNPLSDNAMGDLIPRLMARTKMFEGSLVVLDKSGELTVSTLNDLKSELVAGGTISHLIKGSQASGGGAQGGEPGGGTEGKTSVQKIASGLAKQ